MEVWRFMREVEIKTKRKKKENAQVGVLGHRCISCVFPFASSLSKHPLSAMARMQAVLASRSYTDPRCTHGLLSELSLYYLIYSECSSIRHCPELVWFLFWTLNHSPHMAELWHHDLPEANQGLR